MSQATSTDIETMADLLARLGDIDPYRVYCNPAPGEATEEDLIGGELLPEFTMSLREVFAQTPPAKKSSRAKPGRRKRRSSNGGR